ncbi:MAG: galactokinase family protein [bacterium]|nr:galactokinase family protein [bacterium]
MSSAKFVYSAPGRAGIIGNPSDMYGGVVISCSTQERAYASVEPAEELILATNGKELVIKTDSDLGFANDEFDLAKSILISQGWTNIKCKIVYWTDILMRAGLAGSTALMTSIYAAVSAYLGKYEERYIVSEKVRQIEYDTLKIMCGYQDAYMTVFGGLNYMEFIGKEYYRGFGNEPLAQMEPLNMKVTYTKLPFMLAHTGVQRISGSVHKPIRERWLEGEKIVVQGYQRIAELARLAKEPLLNQDWGTLGKLMNENHQIQRELGGSGAQNEKLIQLALDNGALGAKLAGAGKGGTIIALHPNPKNLEQIFESAGVKTILFPAICPGLQKEINTS